MADSETPDGTRVYSPEADHHFPDEKLNEVLEYVDDDEEITA